MIDLDRALAEHAAGVDIPDGDAAAIMRRARTRRRSRRAGVAVAVTTCVAAVAVVSMAVRSDESPQTALGASAGVVRGVPTLRWDRVPSAPILYQPTRIHSGPPFYTVAATAPSQPDPRYLWRSDDGTDWRRTSTDASGVPFSNVASYGRHVVGVANAYDVAHDPASGPAARAPGAVTFGWSDDGGASFSRTLIPIDVPQVPGIETGSGAGMHVATGPSGTVVLVQQSGRVVDATLLLPGHQWQGDYVQTEEGIELLGPAQCPPGTTYDEQRHPTHGPRRVERYSDVVVTSCKGPTGWTEPTLGPVLERRTWADLGVPPATESALRGEILAFHAPAGSTSFTRVALPRPVVGGDLLLEATDSGFMAVAGPIDAPGTMLTSDDGRSWVAEPGPAMWVREMGRVGGAEVMLGSPLTARYSQMRDGTALLARRVGSDWAVTPLAAILAPDVPASARPHLMAGGVGPLGIVLVADVDEGPIMGEPNGPRVIASVLHVLSSRDGVTWADERLAGLAGGHEPTPEERLGALKRADAPQTVGPVLVLDDHVVITTPSGDTSDALIGRPA